MKDICVGEASHTDTEICQIVSSLLPRSVAAAGGPVISKSWSFAEEQSLVEKASRKRRMEFLSGRTYARQALRKLGQSSGPILIGAGGEPVWPDGIIGSISHCDKVCCAITAVRGKLLTLGVDVEVSTPLEDNLARLICTPDELAAFRKLPEIFETTWANLAFSAKESYYKSRYPLTGGSLDFQNVVIHFFGEPGTTAGSYAASTVSACVNLGASNYSFSGRWAYDGGLVFTTAIVGKS